MTTKTVRHKTNPFVHDMLIPVGKKNVRISKLGEDENVLVNTSTGEVSGTHVVAYRNIDKAKFVKAFADYMAFTFDLTRAGNKALKVVMWAVKEVGMGKDQVVLDKFTLEDFLEAHIDSEPPLKLSYPTYQRGLAELEKAKIIAKTQRVGHYFINPDVIFNGDRKVAFSTVLEVNPEPEGDTHTQQDLLDRIEAE